MHKLQHTINQKVQHLITSLNSKDPAAVQFRLDDLNTIQNLQPQENLSGLSSNVQQKMPPALLSRYRQIKQKIKSNTDILEIISRGKQLVNKLRKYLDDPSKQIEEKHQLWMQVLDEIQNFEKLNRLQVAQFIRLREQLYLQLLNIINQNEQTSDSSEQHFKQCLNILNIPLKKGQTRKEQPSQKQRLKLLQILHQQNCISTLKQQLCNLLEKQEIFTSKMVETYWEPSLKIILYLFTGGSELHNLEEPGWMLQYLHLTLIANYKYLHEFILGKQLKQTVSHTLNHYFLNNSVEIFLYKAIESRLQQDYSLLNPFLSFNFLDEVSGAEAKIQSVFGVQTNIVERLLLRWDGLLEKAFEYENERFEIKIFEDFININYSQVNLKNLEAYNLMLAFLNMLESLHMKYRSITDRTIKQRIESFYRARIMALVAHLKTSFDRIYHHSRLPKLDILVSFKRTEKELRSSLAEMTQADSLLEQSLQKEYYGYLENFYETAALESLTPVHKKLHISLGDILDRFDSPDDTNHEQLLKGFSLIQKEWMSKMDQIHKFSNYLDTKVRSIFFNYLEGNIFSSVGLSLYLKIFEPFLQVIFQEERHRTLLSLITTEKERYLEFMQAHPQALNFLTAEERRKLEKFKRESW